MSEVPSATVVKDGKLGGDVPKPDANKARTFATRLVEDDKVVAFMDVMPQGKGHTSIEIKVNYLKAVRLSSGLLTATGIMQLMILVPAVLISVRWGITAWSAADG